MNYHINIRSYPDGTLSRCRATDLPRATLVASLLKAKLNADVWLSPQWTGPNGRPYKVTSVLTGEVLGDYTTPEGAHTAWKLSEVPCQIVYDPVLTSADFELYVTCPECGGGQLRTHAAHKAAWANKPTQDELAQILGCVYCGKHWIG
jgi:hypothetical protein